MESVGLNRDFEMIIFYIHSLLALLQGICPTYENCSKSWDVITSVLNDLRSYQEIYNIASATDIDYLFKVIGDLKIYIKTVFRHEIEMHSSIKVRLRMLTRFVPLNSDNIVLCF